MFVKITSKRQVTFPKHVLDALGVGPGDPDSNSKKQTPVSYYAPGC